MPHRTLRVHVCQADERVQHFLRLFGVRFACVRRRVVGVGRIVFQRSGFWSLVALGCLALSGAGGCLRSAAQAHSSTASCASDRTGIQLADDGVAHHSCSGRSRVLDLQQIRCPYSFCQNGLHSVFQASRVIGQIERVPKRHRE